MQNIFGVKSSLDLYFKLESELKEFRKDCLSERHAINCAITAWHLTDWTFVEFKTKHKLEKIGDFRASLSCPELKIMHDIATGAKHCQLSQPKTNIDCTGIKEGDFCNEDFDNEDFDVSVLTLKMSDGTEKVFMDELESVVLFWKNYINKMKVMA